MDDKAIKAVTKSGGNTALNHAAYGGFEKVAELLVARMRLEDIDKGRHDGKTALDVATEKGHLETAKIIKFGKLIKLIEAGNSKQKDIETLIKEMSQEELSNIGEDGGTVLHLAAEKDMGSICKLLINKMSPKAIASQKGSSTVLHIAALKGLPEVCILLMNPEIGLNISAINKDGDTALHIALRKRSKQTYDKLIEIMEGKYIEIANNNGDTALHIAADQDMQALYSPLIKKMSLRSIYQKNKEGKKGKTAEEVASRTKDQIKETIDEKATKHFNLAFECIKKGDTSEAQKLIDQIPEKLLGRPVGETWTLLHYAAWNNAGEICKILTEKMSLDDILAKTKNKSTALKLAKQEKHDDTAKIINFGTKFKQASKLFEEGEKEEAIKLFEEVLEIDESYSEKVLEALISLEQEAANKLPKFLINTIAYVPDRKDTMNGDSSSEDVTSEFSEELYYSDEESPPFKTWTTKEKTTKGQKELVEDSELGKVKEQDIEYQENTATLPSRVLQPFLSKLAIHGFEEFDKDKLENSISASIGLNRPKSLSTRKNNVLKDELEANIETSVTYQKFGFFWEYNWYDEEGESVNYKKVHRFYKQLKKVDRDKAEQFREINERTYDLQEKQGTHIPYQALREKVKNHQKTKELVQRLKNQSSDSDIYFSFIDSDTEDFNGIYSAYLRIHKAHFSQYGKGPTVMSTGYEFRGDGEDHPYQVGSQLDRVIRVETAKHIPSGVYYPEPNFCVLLPKRHETLKKSFISKDTNLMKLGNAESVALLRQFYGQDNITFIFSDDNPLITAIPERTKYTEKKTKRSFSPEFEDGGKPTEKDIKALKFNQSHFKNQTWGNNMFINTPSDKEGINKSWDEARTPVKKLVTKDPKKPLDLTHITKLFNNVGVDMFLKIVTAAQGVHAIIEKFKTTGTTEGFFAKKTAQVETSDSIVAITIRVGAKLIANLLYERSIMSQASQQHLDVSITKALKIDPTAFETLKMLLQSNGVIIEHVKTQNDKKADTSWWSDNLLKNIDTKEISTTCVGDQNFLEKYLTNYVVGGTYPKHFIALHVHGAQKTLGTGANHWVGLYIEKIEDNYQVTYVDPMGHEISPIVSKVLSGSLNMAPDIKQPVLNKGIQYTQKMLLEDGTKAYTEDSNTDDCGPFTRFLLLSLLKNKELSFIQKLDLVQSKSLGQKLRKLFDADKDFDYIHEKVQDFLNDLGTKVAFERKLKTVQEEAIQKESAKDKEIADLRQQLEAMKQLLTQQNLVKSIAESKTNSAIQLMEQATALLKELLIGDQMQGLPNVDLAGGLEYNILDAGHA